MLRQTLHCPPSPQPLPPSYSAWAWLEAERDDYHCVSHANVPSSSPRLPASQAMPSSDHDLWQMSASSPFQTDNPPHISTPQTTPLKPLQGQSSQTTGRGGGGSTTPLQASRGGPRLCGSPSAQAPCEAKPAKGQSSSYSSSHHPIPKTQ
jgi:hypothetical protein